MIINKLISGFFSVLFIIVFAKCMHIIYSDISMYGFGVPLPFLSLTLSPYLVIGLFGFTGVFSLFMAIYLLPKKKDFDDDFDTTPIVFSSRDNLINIEKSLNYRKKNVNTRFFNAGFNTIGGAINGASFIKTNSLSENAMLDEFNIHCNSYEISNADDYDVLSDNSLIEINPASGTLMIGGVGGVDLYGNPYGSDNHRPDSYNNDNYNHYDNNNN